MNFEKFMQDVEKMKKEGGVDLSTAEDLSMAVMNLISLEEHFFFTASKTKKSEYFDFSNQVRQWRKELLAQLIGKHEGETWCATKHLLATTMRLIEVGNKLHTENHKKEAEQMFQRAYQVYSLFWALRMKLLNLGKFKAELPESAGWSFDTLVTKLADCCDE